MAYTEQITFLLFLILADEQSKPPHNEKIGVPEGLDWARLLQRDGEELERHYRKILGERASAKRARRRGHLICFSIGRFGHIDRLRSKASIANRVLVCK